MAKKGKRKRRKVRMDNKPKCPVCGAYLYGHKRCK